MCDEYDDSLARDERRWRDPIVTELHAVRECLFEEAGGSVEALVASLKASETARGVRSVSRPPKRTSAPAAEHANRSGEAA